MDRRPILFSNIWTFGAYALVALAVAATALFFAFPERSFEPAYTHSSLLFASFPVVAVARAWRMRRGKHEGAALSWVLAGVVCFAAYDVVWYIDAVGSTSLVAPVGDLLSLFFSPFVLVGLLRGTATPATKVEQWQRHLDAAMLTVGGTTIAFVGSALAHGELRPVREWRDLFLLVSPLTDIVTLGGLTLLWLQRDTRSLPAWARGFGVALLIGLVSDVWFAFNTSVGEASPWFVRGAWYCTWAAIAVGAVRAMRPAPPVVPVARVSRLPYLVATLCYLALASAVLLDRRAAIVAATAGVGVITLLVLARQFVALNDVTRHEADRVRMQADARLAALVRHGSDTLLIVDPDTTVRYASPSHLQVFGIAPDMLVGVPMLGQIHRDDLAAAQLGFDRLLDGTSVRESLIVRVRDSTGRWRWIEAVGTNLLHEPAIAGLVLNSRDITDRKELEVQLLDQALRDPLTSLGNRRLFGDRVMHALQRRVRREESVAVLLLDLDHFKFVNDTLGHAKGDALLVAVAERLRCVLRAEDTIARLGGDEFAVLLEDLDKPEEADATAHRIQQALDRPFLLDEREIFVRASIGIAWASDDQDMDQLLTDADVAMYGAKAGGRGRVERFSSAMRASVAERHDVEGDLRRALERDEFSLAYQPVVDLKSGAIVGGEALLRWQHPLHGVVSPTRLIPVAEESELILAIGRVVLRQATQAAARFRAISSRTVALRVGVNLSARQLLSPHLLDEVHAALRDAGIGGDALTVELTESVLAANERVVFDNLQALRDLGCRIALDDFGTGYSSLAYLRRFPIDILKVDKSFVSWTRDDLANDGVTRAIVSIGESLSLRTVAEGVETHDQLEQLRTFGCTMGQGYLFARPASSNEFAALLATWDTSRFAASRRIPTVAGLMNDCA